MAEETTNPGEQEVETEAPEAEEVTEKEGDGPEAEEEAPEGEEGQEDESWEEFDWQGKLIKAPKGLKDAVMMNADYTQKTQKLSEKEKSLIEKSTQIEAIEKVRREAFTEYAEVHNLNAQIKQLQELDWQKLLDQDRENGTYQTQSFQLHLQQLTNQRDSKVQLLQGKEREALLKTQHEDAKRREEMRDTLARKVKGYSLDLESKLKDQAVELGFSPHEFDANRDPRALETLYWARIGKQLSAQKAKGSKPPPQPVVSAVKTKNKVSKKLEDLDSNAFQQEWVKRYGRP